MNNAGDKGSNATSVSRTGDYDEVDDDDEDDEYDDDHGDHPGPPPNKRAKITPLANDSIITIDDVSTIDASSYIAWVNQQAESLPSVFVAPPTATSNEPITNNISSSATSDTNKGARSTDSNTDIDSSSLLSTLQVFLSNRMDILPPPTVRHLPPASSSFNRNSSQQGNLPVLYSLHNAFFAQDLDDENDNNDETNMGNDDDHPNRNQHPHEWVTNTLSKFSKLRIRLENLSAIQQQQQEEFLHRPITVPKMKDRMAWHIFCLGKDEAYGNVGGRYEYLFEEDEDGIPCGDENSGSNVEQEEKDEVVKEKTGDKEETAINVACEIRAATVPGDDTNTNGSDDQQHQQQLLPDSLPPSDILAIGEECVNPTTISANNSATNLSSSSSSSSSSKPHKPTLPLLLQFDQVLTRSIFHHHVHYFCEYKLPLTRARASWIYAILARLEKPLHREECAAVRSVLRECCERRWNLVLPSTSCDEEDTRKGGDTNSEVWVQLALLNTLIAIAGIYFEQAAFAGGMKNGMDSLFSVS
jgi:hypothetical protein